MNKSKKTIIFISILILLFSLESIFINFTIDFEPTSIYRENFSLIEEEIPEKPASFEIKQGIIFKIIFLNSLLKEVNDDFMPMDGKLEKTVEKIESLLIGHKIALFVNIFIIGLCFSTIFSVIYEAWFSVFIGRLLLIISFFTFAPFLIRSKFVIENVPIVGIPMFIFHLIGFILVTMSLISSYQRFFDSLFKLKRILIILISFFTLGFSIGTISQLAGSSEPFSITSVIIIAVGFLVYGLIPISFFWLVYKFNRYLNFVDLIPTKFNSLLLASYNDEENNARPAIKGIGVEVKKESSFLKIASHFIYIIFTGIIIGNIVYIPLFSLQKHYSSEFGALLFILLILLSIFYVRNYYKIGREEEISSFRNVLVSLSFLQYRFVKNLFFIMLSTLGVVIFITCLFLLLTLNTVILKNHNVIDKTINL